MNADALSLVNLPVLLVGGLLLLAAVTFVARPWRRVTALAAALYCGGLAAWLWRTDLSEPIRRLSPSVQVVDLTAPLERGGFALQLQAGVVPVLTISLAIASFAFLLAMRADQGRDFVPLSLVLLAGYTMFFLTKSAPVAPPLVAPLYLVALSIVGIFVLQAGRLGPPIGPLRSLIPPILAFPLFLVAGWYINQIPLNPQDSRAVETAAQLLALGLLLLLAPAPLHGAYPTTAQSSPPVATALTTLLYQLAVLYLLLRIVNLYGYVSTAAPLGQWLGWAGLLTAIWGGVAALGANHPGRLWGYSALHDWGVLIMVVAVPDVRSVPLAIFLFGLRAISMLTAAAGLSMLEQGAGGLTMRQLQGVGSRMPWNTMAFLFGGLGLAGFPLSAGFTGHWAALQLVAEANWQLSAIVLVASGGTIFGYLRMARMLFGPLHNRYLRRERLLSAALAVLVLLLSASLAVAPQLLNGPISRALLTFGN